MKCLVTGANGFAASHLIERLLEKGHEVFGTLRTRFREENLVLFKDNVRFFFCDYSDPFGIESIIKTVQPDVVFHLAAQSFVGSSWSHPEETLKTNLFGTLYLLEAVRKHCPEARVHIASSSQVYGKIEGGELGLDTLYNPMNPYDTSKLAQDMLSLQYFNSYGLKIIRTRAFNITGPRRGDSFAESSWAKQIVDLERKGGGELLHGNLESARDYIDVRDVVVGYTSAAFEGEPGKVYILGSGKSTKMGDILKILIDCRMDGIQIDLKQDPSRMRPSDTPSMQAKDSSLESMVALAENRPLIPLRKSLIDLLNYYRDKK